MVTEEEISIRQLTTEKMKQESLKQREQRVSYQRAMGMIFDRFSNDEVCPKCNENPCTCGFRALKDKEDKLRDIRGGM